MERTSGEVAGEMLAVPLKGQEVLTASCGARAPCGKQAGAELKSGARTLMEQMNAERGPDVFRVVRNQFRNKMLGKAMQERISRKESSTGPKTRRVVKLTRTPRPEGWLSSAAGPTHWLQDTR